MRVFILIGILLLKPIASFGQNGGCGGHGGDGISQEAFQISKSLLNRIKKLNADQLNLISIPFNPSQLETVLLQTEINSVNEKLYRGDKEVDAKNFGELTRPEIRINRDRWLNYRNHPNLKESVMLHENLGILKSLYPNTGEWDTYELSTQILALLAQENTSSTVNSAATSQKLRALFLTLPPSISSLKPNLSYSCIEYSLLSSSISPLAQKNAFSQLSAQHSNSFERQTNDTFINDFRSDTNGNLLILKTSVEESRENSISYCSVLGSEVVQMIRFMAETTLPYFDLPKSQDYTRYKLEIGKLGQGKVYDQCVGQKDQDACMEIVFKLSTIRLPTEKAVSERYKLNISQINQWLDSLGPQQNQASIPFLAISAATAKQMSYALALLNLGDDPNGADSGIRNFIESLSSRLPAAFENAKAILKGEITRIEIEYIESFEP